ncbi:MAG: hypothetical protein J6S96_01470 [Muribaculaceae bacterium]|nr:hypothetical protein [Muribaculaceae bacterium]
MNKDIFHIISLTVADSAGTVEQCCDYDAWGALCDPDTGSRFQPPAGSAVGT